MSISDQILELLSRKDGLKARDIARELDIDRAKVNSLLHGSLKSYVVQDRSYRWRLREKQDEKEPKGPEPSFSQNTLLARLARYYLECLSQEGDVGVSAFATSRYGDYDYAELSSLPLIEEGEPDIFHTEQSRRLLRNVQRDRRSSTLYLGYPVRLRFVRGRSGWEGYMVEPVFLFPFQEDPESPYGRPRLNTDAPVPNVEVLRSFSTTDSGSVLDEAIQLSEELGLSSDESELPEIDELFLRLINTRPEWDWQENVDPYQMSEGESLSELKQEGIYNRTVLIKGGRSPYTQGLETELSKLGKLNESDYADTALGQWLRGDTLKAETSDDVLLLEPLPLNSEQRQAIRQGSSNPLTVITGPPGTGKSQVVTSLLINAAWQGKKVLFASKNNKAVDVVETRVNSLGPRPILLRIGANEYQRQLAGYLAQILSATASNSDRTNYQTHADIHERLRKRFEELDSRLNAILNLRNEVDRLEQVAEDTRKLFGSNKFSALRQFDLDTFSAHVRVFGNALDQATKEKQSLSTRIFWPFVRNSRYAQLSIAGEQLGDFLGDLNLSSPPQPAYDLSISEWHRFFENLQKRIELVRQAKEYFEGLEKLKASESLEDIAADHLKLQREIAANSKQLWDYWLRLQPSKLSGSQRRLVSEYSSLLQMIVDGNESGATLDRQVFRRYYQLFPEIINILSCWAVTSLSARRVPFEAGFFDLVVIDEASQCDIASALPLLYRAKQAIIIGDPKQLKHISSIPARQDRQLLAKHDLVQGYASWAYSVNSLFDLASSKCRGEDIVTLRDHHRSHAEIISFSNEHFYEGRLRVATNYDRLRRPSQDRALRWLDVQGEVMRPTSGGAINEKEARAVVQEIKRMVFEQGYEGTIGVVSPFRAHATRIRDLAFQDDKLAPHLMRTDFLADTVHKFQGDERDVMIFSPVVSVGIRESALRFLKGNPNLFNVAVTRARSALIVIGDQRSAQNSGVDYLSKFAVYTATLDQRTTQKVRTARNLGPEYPEVERPEQVSEWEHILYKALYEAGLRPIPQYEVEQYHLDFAIIKDAHKLNIEVDGERYHRNWDGELCRRDQIRNQRLIELGWDVMRFWVYQIRDDLDECVERALNWMWKR